MPAEYPLNLSLPSILSTTLLPWSLPQPPTCLAAPSHPTLANDLPHTGAVLLEQPFVTLSFKVSLPALPHRMLPGPAPAHRPSRLPAGRALSHCHLHSSLA